MKREKIVSFVFKLQRPLKSPQTLSTERSCAASDVEWAEWVTEKTEKLFSCFFWPKKKLKSLALDLFSYFDIFLFFPFHRKLVRNSFPTSRPRKSIKHTGRRVGHIGKSGNGQTEKWIDQEHNDERRRKKNRKKYALLFSSLLLNQTAISFLQESLKVTRSSWQYTFLFKFLSCTRTGTLWSSAVCVSYFSFILFFDYSDLFNSLEFFVISCHTHSAALAAGGTTAKCQWVNEVEKSRRNKKKHRDTAMCALFELKARWNSFYDSICFYFFSREKEKQPIFYEQFNLSLTSDLRPINQQKEHRNCEET